MHFLGKPYNILGWIKLTYFRQFKHNVKYKDIDNGAQYFYVENPYKLVKIKKPPGLRPIN